MTCLLKMNLEASEAIHSTLVHVLFTVPEVALHHADKIPVKNGDTQVMLTRRDIVGRSVFGALTHLRPSTNISVRYADQFQIIFQDNSTKRVYLIAHFILNADYPSQQREIFDQLNKVSRTEYGILRPKGIFGSHKGNPGDLMYLCYELNEWEPLTNFDPRELAALQQTLNKFTETHAVAPIKINRMLLGRHSGKLVLISPLTVSAENVKEYLQTITTMYHNPAKVVLSTQLKTPIYGDVTERLLLLAFKDTKITPKNWLKIILNLLKYRLTNYIPETSATPALVTRIDHDPLSINEK